MVKNWSMGDKMEVTFSQTGRKSCWCRERSCQGISACENNCENKKFFTSLIINKYQSLMSVVILSTQRTEQHWSTSHQVRCSFSMIQEQNSSEYFDLKIWKVHCPIIHLSQQLLLSGTGWHLFYHLVFDLFIFFKGGEIRSWTWDFLHTKQMFCYWTTERKCLLGSRGDQKIIRPGQWIKPLKAEEDCFNIFIQ